jgi:hypothetical protein
MSVEDFELGDGMNDAVLASSHAFPSHFIYLSLRSVFSVTICSLFRESISAFFALVVMVSALRLSRCNALKVCQHVATSRDLSPLPPFPPPPPRPPRHIFGPPLLR